MNATKFITAIIVATLLFSCTRHSEHWETLALADHIIQGNPEEALSLLNNIDVRQLDSDKMKARYALVYQYQRYDSSRYKTDQTV